MQSLKEAADQQPFPLLFATISGAHLYGFPSKNSDYDLRGVHILPTHIALRFNPTPETIEISEVRAEIDLDLVTHDVKKFFRLLLKKNGYVLEQLYSPLIVHTGSEHNELKEIGEKCITKHHSHHYLGFAETQWKLFLKDSKLKTLLYVFRVLLTGIHLMRTGKVEANLINLNQIFNLGYIAELVQQKKEGREGEVLNDPRIEFFEKEYFKFRSELEQTSQKSNLPEIPSATTVLDDLLVRLRLKRT
jgi:predicted nucleotidyltransferase